MPAIKTLIFDIGGVLLDIHPEKTFNYWAKATGVSLKYLHEFVSWDIHYQYETGKCDDFQFYSAFNNLLPGENKISEDEFWHGWRLLLGEETSIVGLMESLCQTIPVWLLSNTNPWHIRFLQSNSQYRLHRFVTGAVYSFDTGYRKPDQEIYELTLNKVKSSGGEVLFIDDNEENVEGAKTSGMNAVRYEGLERLIEALEDFEISMTQPITI